LRVQGLTIRSRVEGVGCGVWGAGLSSLDGRIVLAGTGCKVLRRRVWQGSKDSARVRAPKEVKESFYPPQGGQRVYLSTPRQSKSPSIYPRAVTRLQSTGDRGTSRARHTYTHTSSLSLAGYAPAVEVVGGRGVRVQVCLGGGAWCRVAASGSRVKCSGCMIQGLGFRA
jgi:hypothetical protein